MTISHLALYNDLLLDLMDQVPRFSVDLNTAGKQKYIGIMDIPPDVTRREFAAYTLAKSFLKKFQDRSNADAEQVALDSFIAANQRCGEWSPSFSDMEDELLYGLFKQQMQYLLCPNDQPLIHSYHYVFEHMDVGPGASVGAKGTDFYTKLFASPLTTTDTSLATLYGIFLDKWPNWRTAEEVRHDQYGPFQKVVGSRLSFVPKNENTARTICTEPTLNMLVQRGISYHIEKRLRKVFGIKLEDQPFVNRALAEIGSSFDTLATVDLKQASDSISLEMLRRCCPAELFSWLTLSRSPVTVLPSGAELELNMVSSMGNGYTFSLQTAIFACVIAAVYEAAERPLHRTFTTSHGEMRLGNFGVFGDDIIIEKDLYRKVVKLLNILGFEVNSDKSFYEGPFRESCGGDFFHGSPVRGVYLKSLKRPSDRYVAINRLNQWSAVSGIALPRAVQRLVASVRWLPVPLYENDDAGVKVPFSLVDLEEHFGKKRSKDPVRIDGNLSIMYKRWQSNPKLMRLVDGALIVPKGARPRFYNPDGLLLAGLRGNIRNCTIGIRLGPSQYRAKVAVTPNWDWLPPVVVDNYRRMGLGGEPSQRLENAISLNLLG